MVPFKDGGAGAHGAHQPNSAATPNRAGTFRKSPRTRGRQGRQGRRQITCCRQITKLGAALEQASGGKVGVLAVLRLLISQEKKKAAGDDAV